MVKQSSAWKDLERLVTKTLNEGGISAKRVIRQDWGESAPDVVLEGREWVKIDCKYRSTATTMAARVKMLDVVFDKYCEDISEAPVLVSREKGRRDVVVSLWAWQWLGAGIDKGLVIEMSLDCFVSLVANHKRVEP